MSKKAKKGTLKNKNVIYRASYTTKDGRKIYARDYGLKGFPIKAKK